MNRRSATIVLVVLLALAARLVSANMPGSDTAAPQETSWPLANPGFEGAFTMRADPYTGQEAPELGVAEGWDLWYDNVQAYPLLLTLAEQQVPSYLSVDPYDASSYNLRPEYKGEIGTFRVRSGASSQKFFTSYGTHTAGFFQTAQVPGNSWVRFSVWVQTWSSQLDDPEHSFDPGFYRVSVGIDPTGGTVWSSSNIVWSQPVVQHDEWVYLEVAARTTSGSISVWTRGAPIWPVKHNDSYWDDAALTVLDGPPPPTAAPTPSPTAYRTPEPTSVGYEPHEPWHWLACWVSGFYDGTLAGWSYDQEKGTVGVEDGALWLRNPGETSSFPLAWADVAWPQEEDLRLAFRFAFQNQTGYGTTIGLGSDPYAGERVLLGENDLPEIENILSITHSLTPPDQPGFVIRLVGNPDPVWVGTAGDSSWHVAQLELRDTTYVLFVDGVEVGRGVSYWRPQSLYLGNPVVLADSGGWTEVGIGDVLVQLADESIRLPIVRRDYGVPVGTLPPPAGILPLP